MLKEKLKQIMENDFQVKDDMEVQELLDSLLENIGHVDNSLRDFLIYPVLGRWISSGVLTHDQIRQVKDQLLLNLKQGIGMSEDDSVFIRSFSVLQIPTCIYAHIQSTIFSSDEINEIFESVLKYLNDEIDLRSYISGKGWAHAIAHTADALKYLMKLEEISVKNQERVLYKIKEKVQVDYHVYQHKEDERLVDAVLEIVDRQDLSQEIWQNWLESLSQFPLQKVMPNDMNTEVNVRNFMRSLYFKAENALKTQLDNLLN